MINWIDFIIILFFVVYVCLSYKRGFLRTAGELVGILVAFTFALKFYPSLEPVLKSLHLSSVYAKSIGFLLIWFVVQIFFMIIGHYLSFYFPVKLKDSALNRYLGLIPTILKGILLISVILILFTILPIFTGLKASISNSLIGGYLTHKTAQIESQVETVFAGEDGTSTSLTSDAVVENNSALDFTTTDTAIDEASEKQMFAMMNLERAKVGLNPLEEDLLVRNVARVKSRDMLIKGYFAHTSPTGETLLERLNNAHVSYLAAAENIALAPTVDLAQVGLINSPKHKANILDPEFTHVGIGIIDAKEHGIMVTQIFTR